MEAHKEDDNQMGQIICQRTHLNLAKADLWRRSCRRSFRSEWKRLVGISKEYNNVLQTGAVCKSNITIEFKSCEAAERSRLGP